MILVSIDEAGRGICRPFPLQLETYGVYAQSHITILNITYIHIYILLPHSKGDYG